MLKSTGAEKHPRRTGRQAGSFTWHPSASLFFCKRLTPRSVPPSKLAMQAVKPWEVSSSMSGMSGALLTAASVHRPIWVGAALSGPSRHCLHGLLNLDSPGYDGMKPVSSESVLEGEKED